jgi:TorA maturation chaperone TorD
MTGNINSMNTHDELLQAYTTLFMFLGSSVSMPPEQSGLPHLCDSGMLRNLPVESQNHHFINATRLLKSPCMHKQHCHMAIGNNYHDLMSDGNASSAYPAASHWISTDAAPGEHRDRLCGLYRRYGYRREKDCRLEADHLGIELLFTNLLIEKYLTEDDNEIKEMIRKELLAFISDEMLRWIPLWADKVAENSVTKCYTGISRLIVGSLEDVKDILLNQKFGL